MGRRVLVVDDDDFIADIVGSGLRFAGFDVFIAGDGRAALGAADTFKPEVIVLDVMLPDLDGFEVVRRLRAERTLTPVLFLTAKDAVEDKVIGLRMGGDDYITKPFSLEEVVARIEALLRRSGLSPTSPRLEVADLVLDESAHQVWRGGVPVELSPTEFNVLRLLMRNAGRVLSKTQFLETVWGYDFETGSTLVETYISYVRKKLDPLGPPLIHTIRGVGYVLRPLSS